MTAVIGIINKKGVAIASDSAVTIASPNSTKIKNNAEKMFLLSNKVPVSVMVTGNASFMSILWSVVIRRYRQLRGDVEHETVESCVKDFLDFIASEDVFWDEQSMRNWILSAAQQLMALILQPEIDEFGHSTPTRINERLGKLINKWDELGRCEQLQDYSIEAFKNETKEVLEAWFANEAGLLEKMWDTRTTLDNTSFQEGFTNLLREFMISNHEGDTVVTELVFSGYGSLEAFPTLMSVSVFGGLSHRVNYFINPKKTYKISDEHPSAICPFAQEDIVQSLLCGRHEIFSLFMNREINEMYRKIMENGFDADYSDDTFIEMLNGVKLNDIKQRRKEMGKELHDQKWQQWERKMENSDLSTMANMAEQLIQLTGFQRILTFDDEGVGGPIDVAVITKDNGFEWVKRKEWNHRSAID